MPILECDPVTFKNIMERNRVGWVSCRVFEYIPVLMCYKCEEFSHKAEACQPKDNVCVNCYGAN